MQCKRALGLKVSSALVLHTGNVERFLAGLPLLVGDQPLPLVRQLCYEGRPRGIMNCFRQTVHGPANKKTWEFATSAGTSFFTCIPSPLHVLSNLFAAVPRPARRSVPQRKKRELLAVQARTGPP